MKHKSNIAREREREMKDTGLSASYSYSIVSCMMYGIETGNMNNLMLRDVVVHHTAPLCFSR